MRLLFCFLTLALLTVLVTDRAAAAANRVDEMRVIGDPQRTRFVVDLQKSPEYGVLRLANPYRLVIDMPDVEFKDSAKPGSGRGLVSDFRYGLIAPGKARIVLDLSGPAEVVNTFVLEPVSTEPARLVVDLIPTTPEAFAKAVDIDRPTRLAARGSDENEGPVAKTGLPVVVIDPGHGGIDSGAIGDGGLVEKDITLRFGLELERQLNEGGKLLPVVTRSSDVFVSLNDRVAVARRHHAALFVSVHADTVRQNYVRGATVYTLSDDASDALAAAMAERENRSDILAGLALEDQPDDVADILFDLARRETRNLSVRFAKTLVDDMRGNVALNGNPWRRASFVVLKAPEVPSVLLEIGFMSNKDDTKLFKSDNWPESEARTVARAIETFLGGDLSTKEAGQ